MLFIFAMLFHRDSQKRVQEEIDRVVGRNRLPDFSDRESLPLLECLIQETFRLYHPIPIGMFANKSCWTDSDMRFEIGIPHRSRNDDVYRGMFIPKESIVIQNLVYKPCHIMILRGRANDLH